MADEIAEAGSIARRIVSFEVVRQRLELFGGHAVDFRNQLVHAVAVIAARA